MSALSFEVLLGSIANHDPRGSREPSLKLNNGLDLQLRVDKILSIEFNF